MKDRPDESTLVAYHYGELEGEELAFVEAWLQQHPEERHRLKEWGDARTILSHLPDKEVIAPPIVVGNNHRSFWKEGYVRMSLGIAASLLVVLIAARLLGLSASYKAGEMRIGFGTTAPAEQPLSEERVAAMIQASLQQNNAAVQTAWEQDRKNLEENIRKNVLSSSEKIDALVRNVSIGQQEKIREFVGQLQADNLKLMKDYLQLSADGQKEYVQALLVDFSKYLQEQRRQDMQYVQANMSNLQQNTEQFKKDTEQILTSLISSGKTETQRSY
ncbi:MAG: hypothetical protein JNL40_01860 [Cyclobacteriaceae bacterium]|nr:hypothetical protein [Cyclobacteriaceae bacterium]